MGRREGGMWGSFCQKRSFAKVFVPVFDLDGGVIRFWVNTSGIQNPHAGERPLHIYGSRRAGGADMGTYFEEQRCDAWFRA